MSDEKKIQKVSGISAGKAFAHDGHGKEPREGEKPSAPANLVLPKPVKVPVASAVPSKSDKK